MMHGDYISWTTCVTKLLEVRFSTLYLILQCMMLLLSKYHCIQIFSKVSRGCDCLFLLHPSFLLFYLQHELTQALRLFQFLKSIDSQLLQFFTSCLQLSLPFDNSGTIRMLLINEFLCLTTERPGLFREYLYFTFCECVLLKQILNTE